MKLNRMLDFENERCLFRHKLHRCL